jgi:DNA-binding winged helix-turn-helix (wHTH) protein
MSTQATPVARQEQVPALGASPQWPARYARFGKFQLDLLKEELYQEGRRRRVQAKVFQALLVLLSRPGDIVTREEVRKRLWPDAVQVNFDANVNTAMNKLRLLLEDSRETPAYIETVPRRGYSFIATVEFSDQPPPQKVACTSDSEERQNPLPGSRWPLISQLLPAPLPMLSFVLAGMLLGALLVLAWTFLSGKEHRSQNLGHESAAIHTPGPHKM